VTSNEANDLHVPATSALWDGTYASKDASQRSWSEDEPEASLYFIDKSHQVPSAPIIDVGGGASRLVDHLLARGYSDVTVLDISAAAIDEARRRVTDESVHWIVADVTLWTPTRSYALWHDRATFHFLTSAAGQTAYVTAATSAIDAGGHLVLATFAPSGPATCSGLAVQRWSGAELAEIFGDGFSLVETTTRDHATPWGSVQPFTWVLLERRAD
jgi:2-polyprenyl-3-methyl-5-hydroxy-6-metoxy-1,4-benzoquinol methylase